MIGQREHKALQLESGWDPETARCGTERAGSGTYIEPVYSDTVRQVGLAIEAGRRRAKVRSGPKRRIGRAKVQEAHFRAMGAPKSASLVEPDPVSDEDPSTREMQRTDVRVRSAILTGRPYVDALRLN